jgi:hypothetical protein
MWSKLDDGLIDHPKVFEGGDLIGRNGPVIVIGMYALGLMWTNKQLTDGVIPASVVKRFRHAEDPVAVAGALVKARLWERVKGGYRVHDFHDHNPKAADVLHKRKADRERKAKGGRNRNGNGQHGGAHAD